METKIICRRWHWPTLIGNLEIATDHTGTRLHLNGNPISRHPGTTQAASAARHHNTGCTDWDRHQLPTPPLEYWGEIIEVAF